MKKAKSGAKKTPLFFCTRKNDMGGDKKIRYHE